MMGFLAKGSHLPWLLGIALLLLAGGLVMLAGR
jgi:hypothetical protein